MTLGQLTEKLRLLPPESYIQFDFGNLIPGQSYSYRGDYQDISFCFEEMGSQHGKDRVGILLKECEEALDGCVYEGYKGGEFVMNSNTPVWISPYGESSRTMLIDIKQRYSGDDAFLILVTEFYFQ